MVTDRIVSLLESGVAPWRKTWKAVDVPRSMSTGKPYKGLNVFMLMGTAMLEGYSSPFWGTFKAVKERGGNVRKGEKSTLVVFWKFIETKDKDTGEDRKIPFLRYFNVFNADQCDGLTGLGIEGNPASANPIESAEALFESMPKRPEVRFGGDRAFYSPGLDIVGLPLRSSFDSAEAFYSTAFHELIHSTGHSARLNRPLEGVSFGDEGYSKEELIAEMGAAFLCAQAGIERETEDNAASYLAGWISVLKGDPKMIVTAAGAAQKAADYVSNAGAEEAPVRESTTRRVTDVHANHGRCRKQRFAGFGHVRPLGWRTATVRLENRYPELPEGHASRRQPHRPAPRRLHGAVRRKSSRLPARFSRLLLRVSPARTPHRDRGQ
jgi:antirestriction protein ArdC